MSVIRFQERGRARLAKVLAIIHWVCIIPSFICLIAALFIQISIEDKIFFIEDYNGAVLPGILVFTGFFGLFTHILSGKICFANRRVDKRRKWSMYLLPVVIVTFIIFASELVSGIMCFVHISDLGKSFDAGIKVAMAAYRDDISTKEEMDVLQISYDCCGSKGYKDWFSIAWIHSDYISQSKQNGRHENLGDDFYYDDVPFSCCNPAVLRPCIYHHVIDNDLHYNYDYKMQTTLHNTGCTDRLMEYYENSVLKLIGILVLSLSFLQLFNTLACRFLQTAVQNAAGSDDPTGPSLGYLISADKTKDTGINDTKTTDETSTVLDTTDNTEDGFDETFDNDERYVEVFNKEPFYENVEPFNLVQYTGPDTDRGKHEDDNDGEEHIYHEAEVEEYLANRFASSREKFEPLPTETHSYQAMDFAPPPPIDTLPNEEQVEEPIYSHLPPPKPREGNVAPVDKGVENINPDFDSYMPMNISNSSVYQGFSQPKRPMVRTKLPPSPQSLDSQPYVINIKSYKSPSSPVSPMRTSRRMSSPRRRMASLHRIVPSPDRNVGVRRSILSMPMSRRLQKSPSLIQQKHFQIHSQTKRLCRHNERQPITEMCTGLHSPRRKAKSETAFSPYTYNSCNKSKSYDSPKRSRSPEKKRVLEKIEYKQGGSFGCYHSAQ